MNSEQDYDNYDEGEFGDQVEDDYDDVSQENEDQDRPKGVNHESDGEQDNRQRQFGEEQTKQKGKKQKKKEEYVNYYDELLPPDEEVNKKPPIVVVVQGPKKSGKTTLIRSLIKYYTGHKVQDVKGPISIRISKQQRLTLIECPNDMNAMIDLSKIADFALLLIDSSIGLEMETFQFLSLLKCHGFPTVMGVLTHLDFFKDSKQLRKTKKIYKKRFQYEVGGDSKLFHIVGCSNDLYPKRDVINLTRYLYNIKIPRIPWRTNHPYIMVDRWEIAEDKVFKEDSQVSINFYGYVRNSSYRINTRLHIVGMGDCNMTGFEVIQDPCPEAVKDEKQNQSNEKQDDENNQKILDDVGVKRKKKRNRTLNANVKHIYAPHCNLGYLNFDKTGNFITIPEHYVKFTEGFKEDDMDEEGVKLVRELHNPKQTLEKRLRGNDNNLELLQGMEIDQEEQNKQEENELIKFRKKTHQIKKLKARTEQLDLVNDPQMGIRKTDLYSLIYESKQPLKIIDCSRFHSHLQEEYPIKELFVTGMDTDVLKQEDYEEERKRNQAQMAKKKKETTSSSNIKISTNFIELGSYVKITVSGIMYKHFKTFTPESPLLLCRINAGEDNLGFLKVRFKRHRWYANILKSNDPVIVSSGWRRYQTLPVYAMDDGNEKLRYLKYTLEHDFSKAIFYGIFSSQNSGCIFFQTTRSDVKKFRIAATGVIEEINKGFDVMKKLKLVGEPYKIFKNTAFIKGMFNSAIEVANYEGAMIKTVSGIRGQIKKSIKQGHEGTFRATFEDKILMSDIVFCRTWYKIELEKFYNPILIQTRLMKTAYQLRVEKKILPKYNEDSAYKTIERNPKSFAPLIIPKTLERVLPFASKQKFRESNKKAIERKESEGVPKIFMSDKDKSVASLIERLNLIRNEKDRLKQEKTKEKFRIQSARQNPMKQRFEQQKKEHKKEHLKKVSKAKSRGKGRNRSEGNQRD